jgi:NADPH:quinone reductase-like Zn-dependent oxidoreductase
LKRIILANWGEPADVARCVAAPDLPAPGAGEVLFDVVAFPINPADLSFCRGRYRLKPPLPATPGAECVGRVRAIGAGVARVKPGDLVINLQRENWASQRVVREEDVLPAPAGVPLEQVAMLRINAPTARLLLSDLVALKRGDWIIQNAANSAVGRLVVEMGAARGLNVICVTRRADVHEALARLGAASCLIDDDDLASRARHAAGGAPIRLALDAVAGAAGARMAAALADEATLCVYGALSGEDARIATSDCLYRGVRVEGFMLGRFLSRRSNQEIAALYGALGAEMQAGRLHAPVGARYPIEEIEAALRHAERAGHDGKILVLPNGPI